MLSFNEGWYLLYTNTKQEARVSQQLLANHIDHYLPLVRTTKRWSDRLKVLNTPLFPSYLFVHLTRVEDYYTSLQAKGSLYYIRFGKQISRVSDTVVADLQKLTSLFDQLDVSFKEFEEGEKLTISEGPLTGFRCEVVKYKNKEMIIVRISLLKRCVLVELPVYHLSRI